MTQQVTKGDATFGDAHVHQCFRVLEGEYEGRWFRKVSFVEARAVDFRVEKGVGGKAAIVAKDSGVNIYIPDCTQVFVTWLEPNEHPDLAALVPAAV